MAYPFLTLSKQKRTAPIRYDAGGVSVRVDGSVAHGIATIWDADVLIWATSQIVEARDAGIGISRRLFGTSYEVLRFMRRVLMFAPGSVFCRIRWEANDYGTTLWQLAILQAVVHGECMQRIAGIAPGAALLLHVGARDVRTALHLVDRIEGQGMHPADVNARYWRVTHNRLAARAPLAPYTPDRHAALLAQREFA
jgi:hypothetical protein